MKKSENIKYEDYGQYLRHWIGKHSRSEWHTETSNMTNDQYTKYWLFSDGFQIISVNRPVYRTVETKAIVESIEFIFTNEVKLFEMEFWNTEDSRSVFFYEKY